MCHLSPEAARKKACVCSRHGRPCSMPNPQDARNTPRKHAQLPCTSKPFGLHGTGALTPKRVQERFSVDADVQGSTSVHG